MEAGEELPLTATIVITAVPVLIAHRLLPRLTHPSSSLASEVDVFLDRFLSGIRRETLVLHLLLHLRLLLKERKCSVLREETKEEKMKSRTVAERRPQSVILMVVVV